MSKLPSDGHKCRRSAASGSVVLLHFFYRLLPIIPGAPVNSHIEFAWGWGGW